jgi:hypothetical protein
VRECAEKLGLAPDAVRAAVEGLVFLFVESSKLMVSELDFQVRLCVMVCDGV